MQPQPQCPPESFPLWIITFSVFSAVLTTGGWGGGGEVSVFPPSFKEMSLVTTHRSTAAASHTELGERTFYITFVSGLHSELCKSTVMLRGYLKAGFDLWWGSGSHAASSTGSGSFRDSNRATGVRKDCRIRPLRILRNERYPVTVRYYYDDYSGEHRGIQVGKINYRVKRISKPRSD